MFRKKMLTNYIKILEIKFWSYLWNLKIRYLRIISNKGEKCMVNCIKGIKKSSPKFVNNLLLIKLCMI